MRDASAVEVILRDDEEVVVVALLATVRDGGRLPALEHLPRHGLDSGRP